MKLRQKEQSRVVAVPVLSSLDSEALESYD